MRSEEIRIANANFYYCNDYIWSLKKRWIVASTLLVFMTEALLLLIRRLMLFGKYVSEAAAQNLGNEDVKIWIDNKIKEHRGDSGFVIIVLFSFFIFTLLFLIHGMVKSYYLYKMGWIRILLILLFVVEVVILLFIYRYEDREIIFPLTMIVDIASILVSSKLLYPLESRPEVEEGILKLIYSFFDFLTKRVMNRL